MLVAAAGLVLVLGLVALSLLGAHRAGVLVLMGAYFTAPFYKGVAIGGAASLVTATDLLLFAGFALLLPELTQVRMVLDQKVLCRFNSELVTENAQDRGLGSINMHVVRASLVDNAAIQPKLVVPTQYATGL